MVLTEETRRTERQMGKRKTGDWERKEENLRNDLQKKNWRLMYTRSQWPLSVIIVQQIACWALKHNPPQRGAPYERNLARAVAIGPVTVAIEVTNHLYSYGSGVYDVEDCKNQVNRSAFSDPVPIFPNIDPMPTIFLPPPHPISLPISLYYPRA